MKNHKLIRVSSLILLLTCLSAVASAQLPAINSTSSYNHLVEINAEWNRHKNALPKKQVVHFNTDLDRIQYHLDLVITELKANPPKKLKTNQLVNRNKLLNELQKYSNAKVFPTNLYHSVRTPYFIDDYGVHCAVGYLIKVSGNEVLALRISKEHNYDYLANIKTEGIVEWANEFGFTMDELKWIQPNYGPRVISKSIFQANNGIVRGSLADENDNSLISYGSFDSINGQPFYGLVVTKNNVQSTFSSDFKGDVYDVDGSIDDLLVCGELQTLSETMTLGHFVNGSWIYLSSPNTKLTVATKITRINEKEVLLVLSDLLPDFPKSELWSWDLTKNSFDKKLEFVGNINQMSVTANGVLIGGMFLSLKDVSSETPKSLNSATLLKFEYDSFSEVMSFDDKIHKEITSFLAVDSGYYVGLKTSFPKSSADSSMPQLAFYHSEAEVFRSLITRKSLLIYPPDNKETRDFTVNALSLYNNDVLMFGGDFELRAGMFGTANFMGYDLKKRQSFASAAPGPLFSLNYLSDSLIYMTHAHGLSQMSHPVGVSEVINELKLKVYPNPFQSIITVDGLKSSMSYELRDLSGKLIKSGKSNLSKIEIGDDVTDGIYSLMVDVNGQQQVMKIIKQ